MRRLAIYLVFLLVSNFSAASKSRVRKFPDNFIFGASTAAYQIEGGWNEDGKGLSIWDVATHTKPSIIDDGSTGDVAADSYHLYKRDVEMLKELGLDFYRFSVSWPRILPDGFGGQINQAGVSYYNKLIDELLDNNIKPMLTIYHWDLPNNLQKLGGWTNPHISDWFVDYARVLFENFGDRVKMWVTINEPKQVCYDGYGVAEKAPHIDMVGVAEYMCSKNILLAHAKAYRLYDTEYRKEQNGTIGISFNTPWAHPASDSLDDHQAALDARQFYWGQFAHPIFSKDGDYPPELKRNVAQRSSEQGYKKSRLPELSLAEISLIKESADFFGVNAYTTNLAYRDASVEGMYPVPSFLDDMRAILIADDSWPQAKSKWLREVPWGFYNVLVEIKNKYNNPIVYITENGWSTAGGLLDDDRIHYLRSYLSAMLDAASNGCDIRGYAVWSLMDNFEWNRGYIEKFGLYEVDFSSPERTRTPRKSAFVYKEIVRTKCLDPDFEPEMTDS